ncbi:MAG: glycosyltransferase family 2 protein [Acidimicrobiales bacterium]
MASNPQLLGALTHARDSESARAIALGGALLGSLDVDDAAAHSSWTTTELDAEIAQLSPDSDAAQGISQPPPLVSVVVPAFDEQDNVGPLHDRIVLALNSLEREGESFEIVFVDDGSGDDTWSVISKLAANDPRVRGLSLSRNFGQQAALSAGMTVAEGRTVCFLDADLQDPPELIVEMLESWADGYEVVYAVRRSRDAGRSKKFAYSAFYRVYRLLADIDVPLDSGDFALLDRRVVDEILALPEHNRFLRGLRSWVGFEQVGIEFDRPERTAGEPKLSLARLVRLALDGVTSLSAKPLRLATLVGLVTACIGLAFTVYAVIARLTSSSVPSGWASTIAVILTMGGIQLLVLGVLGEYLARVFDEAKQRPNFIIAETTGEG